MFEPTSRYFALPDGTLTSPDGRVITYRRRRFLPQGKDMALLVEVTLEQGERLDNVTARTLGQPEQFWRVCDANDVMNPFDLEIDSGRPLRVPIPQP
jgi:hypothetical protein